MDDLSLDTSRISEWRSIVTLVVFVLVNLAVIFPFHIPIPKVLRDVVLDCMSALRIIPPKQKWLRDSQGGKQPALRRFPINFVTAPLIGDLFLLAILAINGDEVYKGTIGNNGISPIEIMAFFITLAYIAISIDASGLLRYLAFKVVDKRGKFGHELFVYMYAFFFGVGSFIGNDPIVLSGTAFLAYMTRISSNIQRPTAWIYTQFAVANTASAILVTSNPTNLVLAGAFNIRFIDYTANMIVPVVITAIVLLPFLLYIVFNEGPLIPYSIVLQELPKNIREKKPVNPNIPHARESDPEKRNLDDETKGNLISLEEVLNPFLDRKGAWFGAVIMATTLIVILGINARFQDANQIPVFYVTLPAAFVMLCWDITLGWLGRHDTREVARKGREEIIRAHVERTYNEKNRKRHERIGGNLMMLREMETPLDLTADQSRSQTDVQDIDNKENPLGEHSPSRKSVLKRLTGLEVTPKAHDTESLPSQASGSEPKSAVENDNDPEKRTAIFKPQPNNRNAASFETEAIGATETSVDSDVEDQSLAERIAEIMALDEFQGPQTLASLLARAFKWAQETFPTVMAILTHLPFPLVPFALAMFVLVQALASNGWVNVFAYGWDHWVNQTGTVGAIGGMGFLSVILCNFAGTNIGTTILLSRIVQQWEQIRRNQQIAISDRMFWGTVYSMALGVNYGAYSTTLSASLAGLLWRDILRRKEIFISQADFARINLPIIAVAMVTGCVALIGEVYIKRTESPYSI